MQVSDTSRSNIIDQGRRQEQPGDRSRRSCQHKLALDNIFVSLEAESGLTAGRFNQGQGKSAATGFRSAWDGRMGGKTTYREDLSCPHTLGAAFDDTCVATHRNAILSVLAPCLL